MCCELLCSVVLSSSYSFARPLRGTSPRARNGASTLRYTLCSPLSGSLGFVSELLNRCSSICDATMLRYGFLLGGGSGFDAIGGDLARSKVLVMLFGRAFIIIIFMISDFLPKATPPQRVRSLFRWESIGEGKKREGVRMY